MGDLRAELLAAFEAELADHLGAIRAGLAAAEAGKPVDLRDVSRRAHSLKGAARAVDQPAIEALAHQLESLLLDVEAAERSLDGGAIADLRRLLDAIQDEGAGDEPVDEAAPPAAGQVRVGGQHVERMARTLHDLAMQVQDGALVAEGLQQLQSELASLAASAERERAHELARRLTRCVSDAERLRRQQADLQWTLEQTTSELEEDAEHILLLPIETLFDGYERMVRELAESQGKAAILRVETAEGEADRRVLQALRDPVLHLLRNAVSHGIEPGSRRRAAGKPEQGQIQVRARIERGQLLVAVADDGGGLDYRRIEAKARSAGLIAPGSPTPSSDRLEQLLFEQGFSTADRVDEVAGRGIGLAVAAEAVRRLHGSVSIVSSRDRGTEIGLAVPSALSRQTLLLCEAGGQTFALPTSAVAQVLRLAPEEVERSEGGEILPLEGGAASIMSLAALLGLPPGAPDGRHHPALLLRVGDRRIVLAVDALDEVRSVLVGDPTAIAVDLPLVYGTVQLESGVVLVLSPEGLLARAGASAGAGGALARSEAAQDRLRRTVLVVDDSITTRTLEKSILEAQGYSVLVSVDGLEALERLRSGLEPIDLVVADVEMPRMDGFALLTAIRNDPALKAIPVVMMTSRNSPDDIDRGLELGANAYVTKQAFDQGELISVIQQFI